MLPYGGRIMKKRFDKASRARVALEKKLSRIRDIIGEAVVFEVGMRKSGKVDLLSVKSYPEPEIETAEQYCDAEYIG